MWSCGREAATRRTAWCRRNAWNRGREASRYIAELRAAPMGCRSAAPPVHPGPGMEAAWTPLTSWMPGHSPGLDGPPPERRPAHTKAAHLHKPLLATKKPQVARPIAKKADRPTPKDTPD